MWEEKVAVYNNFSLNACRFRLHGKDGFYTLMPPHMIQIKGKKQETDLQEVHSNLQMVAMFLNIILNSLECQCFCFSGCFVSREI